MKILDKKVEKVTISNKLVSSLCCIMKGTYKWAVINGANHEGASTPRQNSTICYLMAQKHIEIHPDHPIMESLQQNNWRGCQNLVVLLFKTTLFSPGFSLEDPKTHSNYIYCVIILHLGTDENEVTVELSVADPTTFAWWRYYHFTWK